MALIPRKAICEGITPLIQIKRFRGKINIQKPRPPHFEKSVYLQLTKPWFLPQKKEVKCTLLEPPKYKTQDEENPFRKILADQMHMWFTTSRLIAFCHHNPMSKEQEFDAFAMLHKEKMHFKKHGKKTLEMALKGTPYETVLDIYMSHTMTIFSPEPEIKKLVKILKRFPQLVLMAGIYENRLLSKDELMYYSTIPNLQAAQAGFVQTINSVGSQLVSNLNSHQTTLVSHLEQRAKQLEEIKS